MTELFPCGKMHKLAAPRIGHAMVQYLAHGMVDEIAHGAVGAEHEAAVGGTDSGLQTAQRSQGTAVVDIVVGDIHALGDLLIEHAPQLCLNLRRKTKLILDIWPVVSDIRTEKGVGRQRHHAHLEVAGKKTQNTLRNILTLIGKTVVEIVVGTSHAVAGMAHLAVHGVAWSKDEQIRRNEILGKAVRLAGRSVRAQCRRRTQDAEQ